MTATAALPTFNSLDELTQLITHRHGLYVRWSRGPESDLPKTSSTDDLTGIKLPGLSASPLGLEDWWGERPVRVWVARRLYDYCHLPHIKDARTRPWVLHGSETARGPDNEPPGDTDRTPRLDRRSRHHGRLPHHHRTAWDLGHTRPR
ncbi:DUF6098 family protein [Streptomyces massasporeus]|uniref:DUF6098 family protein n=1 Tax=Streptomyces massasporeus TaxID=67324 RepID=UPI003701D50B